MEGLGLRQHEELLLVAKKSNVDSDRPWRKQKVTFEVAANPPSVCWFCQQQTSFETPCSLASHLSTCHKVDSTKMQAFFTNLWTLPCYGRIGVDDSASAAFATTFSQPMLTCRLCCDSFKAFTEPDLFIHLCSQHNVASKRVAFCLVTMFGGFRPSAVGVCKLCNIPQATFYDYTMHMQLEHTVDSLGLPIRKRQPYDWPETLQGGERLISQNLVATCQRRIPMREASTTFSATTPYVLVDNQPREHDSLSMQQLCLSPSIIQSLPASSRRMCEGSCGATPNPSLLTCSGNELISTLLSHAAEEK